MEVLYEAIMRLKKIGLLLMALGILRVIYTIPLRRLYGYIIHIISHVSLENALYTIGDVCLICGTIMWYYIAVRIWNMVHMGLDA